MLMKTDSVDEIKVGIENLLRSATAECAHQQRYDAFHDYCVAVGLECDYAVGIVSLKPHAALTSFNYVVGCFVALVKRRHLVAQVDDICVAIHPIA